MAAKTVTLRQGAPARRQGMPAGQSGQGRGASTVTGHMINVGGGPANAPGIGGRPSATTRRMGSFAKR